MRGVVLLLSLAAMCGGARASSLVAMGEVAPASTPSFVSFSGTEPVATASILALGEPAPGVSDDKVAAIPAPRPPRLPPVVIRGGVVGGQSAVAAAPAPAPVAAKPAAAADAAPQQPAADVQPPDNAAAPKRVPL